MALIIVKGLVSPHRGINVLDYINDSNRPASPGMSNADSKVSYYFGGKVFSSLSFSLSLFHVIFVALSTYRLMRTWDQRYLNKSTAVSLSY